MAFDEHLAERVRERLAGIEGIVEKKMFGGLAFLLNGNMSCGVHGDGMIVRVVPEATEGILEEPGASVFDLTGRPMKGWVMVEGGAVQNEADLAKWVDRGVAYAGSLPPKKK